MKFINGDLVRIAKSGERGIVEESKIVSILHRDNGGETMRYKVRRIYVCGECWKIDETVGDKLGWYRESALEDGMKLLEGLVPQHR
jgi:hypothetical protein